MADVTVDALTELTTIADGDYFPVYDASAAALKKVSRANALANVFITNTPTTVTAVTTFDAPIVMTRYNVTIAAGVVTVQGNALILDTEAAAATDDLDTINGGTTGQIVILQTANSSRDVVVKHGTGNLFLTGRVDFTLTGTRDKLVLICISTEWHEIGRGDNAV